MGTRYREPRTRCDHYWTQKVGRYGIAVCQKCGISADHPAINKQED